MAAVSQVNVSWLMKNVIVMCTGKQHIYNKKIFYFFCCGLSFKGGYNAVSCRRVVYTVKELDSHAKHGQSFKNLFGCITEYFCAKHLTSGFVQVSESFFDRGSCWCKRRWNSLYGHFSRKNAPVHTSTWARARTLHPTALLHGTHSGRMSLKNVFLWGKDNLVQLPEEPSVMWTVDGVCFSGAATEFLKWVC